jgi:hypothetical protein
MELVSRVTRRADVRTVRFSLSIDQDRGIYGLTGDLLIGYSTTGRKRKLMLL